MSNLCTVRSNNTTSPDPRVLIMLLFGSHVEASCVKWLAGKSAGHPWVGPSFLLAGAYFFRILFFRCSFFRLLKLKLSMMGNKARWVMFHLLSSISRFELWSYPSLTLIFWLPFHQRRAASSRPTVAEQLGRPKGSPSTKCPTYYPSHFALMNNNVPYAQPSRTSSYFHRFYYARLGLALWMDKGKTKEDDRPDPAGHSDCHTQVDHSHMTSILAFELKSRFTANVMLHLRIRYD